MYQDKIFTKEVFGKIKTSPQLSVIVVTYDLDDNITHCLDALQEQTDRNFEIILIDNGKLNTEILEPYNLTYIKLQKNSGPSYARNIGASVANADLLAFLDDDAIPSKNWVNAILIGLQSDEILGVRGRVEPKKSKVFNYLATHYYLGEKIIPWLIDLEGNFGIKKREFLKSGGFNAKLFGEEGIELSYRLNKISKKKLLYDPSIIIYHDYSDSLWHFIDKNFRHGRNHKKNNTIHSDFSDKFYQSLQKKNIKPNLDKRILRFPVAMIGLVTRHIGGLYYEKS